MAIGIIGPAGLEGVLRMQKESAPIRLKKEEREFIDFYRGNWDGKEVIFVPRHPEGEPARATDHLKNMILMYLGGAHQVIGVSEARSLDAKTPLREFILPDQLYMQRGEEPTFYTGDIDVRVNMREPVCMISIKSAVGRNRKALEQAAKSGFHLGGIYVNIPGPALTTMAEADHYRKKSYKVIPEGGREWEMKSLDTTQPIRLGPPPQTPVDIPEALVIGNDMVEAYAAKELGLCYRMLAVVTNYENVESRPVVPQGKSAKIFNELKVQVKDFLRILAADMPDSQDCRCGNSLRNAVRHVGPEADPLLVSILKQKGGLD